MWASRLFCALAQLEVVVEAVVLLLLMALATAIGSIDMYRALDAPIEADDVDAWKTRGITEGAVSFDFAANVAALRSADPPPRSRPSSTRAATPIMFLTIGVAGATETTLLLEPPPLCIWGRDGGGGKEERVN